MAKRLIHKLINYVGDKFLKKTLGRPVHKFNYNVL